MADTTVARAWNSAQPIRELTLEPGAPHVAGAEHLSVATEDGGTGGITIYELFPGIRLVQFELKTKVLGEFYALPPHLGLTDNVALVFCKQGSMELDREDELSSVVQTGEVAIGATDSRLTIVRCPLGQVRGMAILMSRGMRAESRRVLMTFGVDPSQVRSLAYRHEKLHVISGRPELSHACEQLCYGRADASKSFYRLKTVEVLQLLVKTEPKATGSPDDRRRRSTKLGHVELAYRAQQIMMGNLSTPVTINSLAESCGTSPTVLKEAFRETFGKPVYRWYREYRIRHAAQMLRDTDLSISEVASSVGYANPSKFTKAFADTMGKTPRDWRASRDDLSTMSDKVDQMEQAL